MILNRCKVEGVECCILSKKTEVVAFAKEILVTLGSVLLIARYLSKWCSPANALPDTSVLEINR